MQRQRIFVCAQTAPNTRRTYFRFGLKLAWRLLSRNIILNDAVTRAQTRNPYTEIDRFYFNNFFFKSFSRRIADAVAHRIHFSFIIVTVTDHYIENMNENCRRSRCSNYVHCTIIFTWQIDAFDCCTIQNVSTNPFKYHSIDHMISHLEIMFFFPLLLSCAADFIIYGAKKKVCKFNV